MVWVGFAFLAIFLLRKYQEYSATPPEPVPTTPQVGEEVTPLPPTPAVTSHVAVTPAAELPRRDQGLDLFMPGVLELYPTYTAIGIQLTYAGDANTNATAELFWRRQGEPDWRRGIDMTIDRRRQMMWASIWPLEPDVQVEVRIVVSDPEPLDPPIAGVVATRRLTLEAAGGRTFHVSALRGSDANPGDQAAPFKTIGRALKGLQPGDTVLVHSGIYKEMVNMGTDCQGTPDNPLVIMAASGEQPVIDSSVEIGRAASGWQPLGDGIYRRDADFGETAPGYVSQDNLRMFCHESLESFKQDVMHCRRACFYDGERKQLYVRVPTGDSPALHVYRYATLPYGFYLEGARHVVVRGFEIRNCGSAGIRISGCAAGNVIFENQIHNCPGGIFLKDLVLENTLIWSNVVYEAGLGDFAWNAIKKSAYARQGVMAWKSGRGLSICHNTIYGWFDGIDVEGTDAPDVLAMHRDCDVMFNRVFNIGDDAFELDGGGVNLRCHGNTVRNAHSAISLAPVERGPVYVTRNDCSCHNLFLKMSVGSPSEGWTYCFNNSGYTMLEGNEATMIRFNEYSLPDCNRVLKNNAMIGSEWAVHRGRSGCHELDYNCYFNTPETGFRKFQWDNRVYTDFATFQMETGQERHGLYADPMFRATPDLAHFLPDNLPVYINVNVGDLRPQPGSPLIDRGAMISGVTDEYRGEAPDIGAFEYEE